MSQLVIKRVLQAIPTLLVVSFLMFLLLFMGPNPLQQLKQNPNIRDADIKRLTKQYGWDKPWYAQYVKWGTNFVKGDLGDSVQTMRPAKELISERLPLTLMLTGLSMIFSMMIAIPIGAYVAVKKYSKADYAATFLTFTMMATPSFFLALLLQLFALKLGDMNGGNLVLFTAGAPSCAGASPSVFGQVFSCMGTPIEVFRRLALPVAALSMLQVAGWSRYQRSELLNVLNSEYIKCAMAKGIPFRDVFVKHAMRNTMLPMVTIVAVDVALLFGGAVITETVFSLPGMGSLLLQSVLNRDVVVALDIVMISTILVLVFNTVADVMYGVLDPRVRVT